MQLFTSQDVNMDWSGVDYCDVFISCLVSHSDGTHSLQRIHWWESDVMLHFSKSVLMKKKTHLHLGWPKNFICGKNIPLKYWGGEGGGVKNKNDVIIYSPLHCSKYVWLYFLLCDMKDDILKTIWKSCENQWLTFTVCTKNVIIYIMN